MSALDMLSRLRQKEPENMKFELLFGEWKDYEQAEFVVDVLSRFPLHVPNRCKRIAAFLTFALQRKISTESVDIYDQKIRQTCPVVLGAKSTEPMPAGVVAIIKLYNTSISGGNGSEMYHEIYLLPSQDVVSYPEGHGCCRCAQCDGVVTMKSVPPKRRNGHLVMFCQDYSSKTAELISAHCPACYRTHFHGYSLFHQHAALRRRTDDHLAASELHIPPVERITGRFRDGDDQRFEVGDYVEVEVGKAKYQATVTRVWRNETYDVSYFQNVKSPNEASIKGKHFVSTECTGMERHKLDVMAQMK
jgi:hypothetical protein